MRKFIFLITLSTLLASGAAAAQSYEEGRHFDRIGSPVSMPDDKVVVTDAFGYPCPACRRFLPYMDAWAQDLPDHVEVEHLPIALQPGWDLFARAYYTAQVMGIADASHEAMFKAVHDERRQFRSFEDIADFYSDFGVEAKGFVNTSKSFAVDARMRQNRNDVRTFGVRSTPTVVVQGKWRVSPNGFNSYEEMLDVVGFLVEREAEALGLGGDDSEPDSGGESVDADPAADDHS